LPHLAPRRTLTSVGSDSWDLVDAERLALADFLTGLSSDEWSTPSLCGDWSVQDVAAHLAYANTMPLRALVPELARDRFRANRTNARLARQWARRGSEEIVARLRDVGGAHSRTPITRPQDVLADFVCHNIDIRRPLGRERLAPLEPTRLALTTYVGMGVPQALAFGRNPKVTARGLHLVADDVGWEHGDGPLVTAPSSALIRALTGRPVGDDELSGPGSASLYARLAQPASG
jgi:uncharacterized protein (TIGR03083 family)